MSHFISLHLTRVYGLIHRSVTLYQLTYRDCSCLSQLYLVHRQCAKVDQKPTYILNRFILD